MKTFTLISTALISFALSTQAAHAARSENQQAALEGGTFATAAIVGTIAAGPVGFVIGALGGAFLADQTKQANDNEIALANAQQDQALLEQTLVKQEQEISQLELETLQTLTFQVMFATGNDQLNDLDLKRVQVLADYLIENPELVVQLDGHTDPRGTEEYNNVLSAERALSIKTALIELGVDASRISSQGHADRFSNSSKGDLDGYSHDRRVDISVQTTPLPTVATN